MLVYKLIIEGGIEDAYPAIAGAQSNFYRRGDMKMRFRVLLGLWVLVASWSLSYWWQTHPDTVLNLPDFIWDWLANLYGVDNAEHVADLVSIVALVGSLIVVSALTWLLFFIWRRCRWRIMS